MQQMRREQERADAERRELARREAADRAARSSEELARREAEARATREADRARAAAFHPAQQQLVPHSEPYMQLAPPHPINIDTIHVPMQYMHRSYLDETGHLVMRHFSFTPRPSHTTMFG